MTGVEQPEKTMDELLDERRRLENRVNELYGFLLRIHEVVSSLQTLAAVLAGANIGILLLLVFLLLNLAQAT